VKYPPKPDASAEYGHPHGHAPTWRPHHRLLGPARQMLPDDLRPQTAGDPLPSAAVVERGLAGCEGEELVCGGVPGACSEGQAIRVRNHECRRSARRYRRCEGDQSGDAEQISIVAQLCARHREQLRCLIAPDHVPQDVGLRTRGVGRSWYRCVAPMPRQRASRLWGRVSYPPHSCRCARSHEFRHGRQ